ncbi:phosphohydrolase [Janthinobacterium sp. SUN118]|uniref:phosphohydrolase n=1 Tax=Janthinobacterium sp. SUN118 TaxID=3004100 RepID=UPI0025B077E7|nr:phosphohydrolase [Janthinobacterium sp. SUN118]MDN2709383.1 phosphohydrolase [Janthinobacterium sp. SUN118]
MHSRLSDPAMITTDYVSTFSGNRFYPLRPHIDKVAIEDIAHGLAYQCRFNGQTQVFYSVAQHSLIVASLVPPPLRLAALLHDAAEAYLGDMVKPLKVLLPEFAALEDKVSAIIAATYGLDFSDYAPIKRADLIALATEKRDLMPHSAERWAYLDGIAPLPGIIDAMGPAEAKQRFLHAFAALTAPGQAA